MRMRFFRRQRKIFLLAICLSALVCLSACGGTITTPVTNGVQHKATQGVTSTQKPTTGSTPLQLTSQPKTGSTPATTPTQGSNQPNTLPALVVNTNRPLLAFYYAWYTPSSWCSCRMSDLPSTQYNSNNDATITRQVTEAANAGITGFINSWWGPGDVTDTNFAKLLERSATLESQTKFHFASTIYFESDAPALKGTANMVNALRYMVTHYSNDPHFLHWQGKPVLFFWNPLGNGRTLAQWVAIRSQVDPNNQMIWSAEGTNMTLLSAFDGIHLFSAGYWGIQRNDMPTVDQGFRNQINAYNAAHGTHKIWAAGVLPGYDDTRVPGRSGTYIVPRNNGATYQQSWAGALSSQPDWITITSFNEWYEGAMIEPSVTYGNQYLTLTQQYSKEWHG